MHWSLPNIVRLTFGMLIWVAVVFAVQFATKGIDESMPVNRVRHHFNPNHLWLELPIPPLDHRKEPNVADPIKCSLTSDGPALLTQIGEVSQVEYLGEHEGYKVTLCIWEEYKHLAKLDSTFLIFGGPSGFDEIVSTLFDDHAKQELAQRWNTFVSENKTELKATVGPILESTLNEFMVMVMPSIEEAFSRHQNDLWEVLRYHWESDVKATLLPMLKSKADPRINSEIIPLCMDCVQELWEKAPAGSFAWNAFRDKVVPWDAKDNLRKRFVQWLDDEGKTIIDAHLPGVLTKGEEIAEDLMRDKEVREALAVIARKIFNHPKLKSLAQIIVQEAIMDNPATITFFEAKLKSPEMQAAIERLGGMIEPYVRDMIDSVLLDPHSSTKKINPNLVKVMRAQILWKKDFWLLLKPGNGNGVWNDFAYKASAVRYGFAE